MGQYSIPRDGQYMPRSHSRVEILLEGKNEAPRSQEGDQSYKVEVEPKVGGIRPMDGQEIPRSHSSVYALLGYESQERS